MYKRQIEISNMRSDNLVVKKPDVVKEVKEDSNKNITIEIKFGNNNR